MRFADQPARANESPTKSEIDPEDDEAKEGVEPKKKKATRGMFPLFLSGARDA